MPLIAELHLKKQLEAVPSVLPSPELLANPLSLDFEGFERNSRLGGIGRERLSWCLFRCISVDSGKTAKAKPAEFREMRIL